MSPTEQAKLKMSYIQTTFAVYELIKLDHEVKNGNIVAKLPANSVVEIRVQK